MATSPQSDDLAHAYVREKGIALGQSLSTRQKFYLDTRYWLFLRDAAMGRARSPAHFEILAALRTKVQRGEAVCPLSDSILVELLRQEDPVTRRATAQLVDELSLGVSILTEESRVATELAHFLTAEGAKASVHPLDHLIWTKACFAMGFSYPHFPNIPSEQMHAIQFGVIDRMWEGLLVDAVDGWKPESADAYPFEGIADRLNVSSKAHGHEIRSYPQALVNEFAGGLDLAKDTMVNIFEMLYAKQHGAPPSMSDAERERQAVQIRNFFIGLFKKRPQHVGKRLPTLYVHAKCHAAIRWDRRRQLNGHDLLDFHHASAAVGHCHAFFTEAPLKALLESGNVAIGQDFTCRIVASEDDVLKLLGPSAPS